MSVARARLGVFIDQHGCGVPRLVFTDEEIKWISRHFFLLQLTRDDFIVKNTIKRNVSPERVEQRAKEQNELLGANYFKPQLCRKSLKMVEKEEPKSPYLKLQKTAPAANDSYVQ